MSNRLSTGRLFFALILGVSLIHGGLYVFLVPPWQHNDEPNHFEYAWLVVHCTPFPNRTDYDLGLSRAVMTSMVAHHFFDGMGYLPDLTPGQPVHISGYSQLTDPPLYYLIASIPIRLVAILYPGASIEVQLYAARLASLGLLIVSLLAAWGLVSELTGPTNPLRWLVPITMALWPGFIDLMTAVTDLAGGVAVFSLFLWFCVRLIRRGVGWLDLSGAALTTVACLLTLPGLYIAVPLLGVALLFAVTPKRWKWFSWGLLFLGFVAGLVAIFSWGDADLWYRETWQADPTTENVHAAPLGKKAFQLVVSSQYPPSGLYQLIPPSRAKALEGKTVTLGAWMWSSYPVQVKSPILKIGDGESQYSGTFSLIETPTFHAITATLTGATSRAWVMLSLPISTDYVGTDVYFDGVVLAEGSFPLDESPIFISQDARRGTWGEKQFINLVRNPSGEITGPRIRLWVDRQSIFNNYGRVSMVLYTLRDWSGAGWYFRGTAVNLVRTLWGKFGWNHVPYLGHKPYRIFLVMTILGLVGVMGIAWHKRKNLSWELLVWLGMVMFLSVLLTVARGMIYLWYKPFIPSARYLSPVIPMIVFTLVAGWWEILRVLTRRLPSWVPNLVYITLFLGIDIFALVSLAQYYYR